MRKPIIAGNWKMNTTLDDASALATAVASAANTDNHDVVLCPPFISLAQVAKAVAGTGVAVGAQTVNANASGAYTGETSTAMITSTGASYVIVGHSERRTLYNETNAQIQEKVSAALDAGLTPILCVGETLAEREAGQAEAVVNAQLTQGLQGLESKIAESNGRLVVAYEPVWAIGTGKVATPEEAQAMHASIRAQLGSQLGEDLASGIRLQYGGSVKPGNAADLFTQPDIDGALVGGASLKAEDFVAIINAYALVEG